MKLLINGVTRDFAGPLTVAALLDRIGLADKPVVVEINRRALFPREHAGTALQDGDAIEVVQITAGG